MDLFSTLLAIYFINFSKVNWNERKIIIYALTLETFFSIPWREEIITGKQAGRNSQTELSKADVIRNIWMKYREFCWNHWRWYKLHFIHCEQYPKYVLETKTAPNETVWNFEKKLRTVYWRSEKRTTENHNSYCQLLARTKSGRDHVPLF